MAYKKPDVKTIEDGIIQTSINKYDIDEGRDLKYEKRDKRTAHVSNMEKKIKVDVAMEMCNETESEIDAVPFESDTIEGEAETVNTEPSISVEMTPQQQKNKELGEKLSKYNRHQLPTDSDVFKGLHLNAMQKKFVINYCDPESPHYGDKHTAYIAAGYSAKNKNSLIANISMNLKKPKIKSAIDAYRKSMINSKKLEVSTEMVDILRHRATYDLSYFEDDEGNPKPYSEIPEEWRCCVDGSEKKYFKGTDGDYEIKRWVLCDRHKSMQELMKVMEVHQSVSSVPKNPGGRPPNQSVTAAVDMGKDKDGNQGPRVVFNMSLFQEDENG